MRIGVHAARRGGSADGRRLLNSGRARPLRLGARRFPGLTFDTVAGGRLPTPGARAGMSKNGRSPDLHGVARESAVSARTGRPLSRLASGLPQEAPACRFPRRSAGNGFSSKSASHRISRIEDIRDIEVHALPEDVRRVDQVQSEVSRKPVHHFAGRMLQRLV